MKVFAVIADQRAKNSLSPNMHNHALFKAKLDGSYVSLAITPKDLEKAIQGLKALNFAGVNVTVPHKQKVIPFLDELNVTAKTLGAVNTIEFKGNKLIGHNTDMEGFCRALNHTGVKAFNRNILVMGAGGAARAIVYGLLQLKAKNIWVCARNLDQAQTLTKELGGTAIELEQSLKYAGRADILINATSVSGPKESKSMVDLVLRLGKAINPELIMDLNYGRPQNIWQDLAKQKNAVFQDGLMMLAQQARLSFEIWTGLFLPVNDFLKGLETKS